MAGAGDRPAEDGGDGEGARAAAAPYPHVCALTFRGRWRARCLQVDIGAFRTYPQGYKPPEGESSEFESVPLNKIEDFGAHQNQYYQLEISYFKSACDTALLNAIWNKCARRGTPWHAVARRGAPPAARPPHAARRPPPAAWRAGSPTDAGRGRARRYWIATLSASPLLSNSQYISAQMKDIADKLESAEGGLSHFGRGSGGGSSYLMGAERSKKDDTQLKKIVRDSSKLAREHLQAAMTQTMKHLLFNTPSIASAPTAMDTS